MISIRLFFMIALVALFPSTLFAADTNTTTSTVVVRLRLPNRYGRAAFRTATFNRDNGHKALMPVVILM